MTLNTGNGSRIGIIRYRNQRYNPVTRKWVLFNNRTGRIIVNSDTRYRAVRWLNKDKNPENF